MSNELIYQKLTKQLFINLVIRKLSFVSLNIKTIEIDTFTEECCGSTLESLDLSDNKLNRLDRKVFQNLKRLEILNLAKNRLQFSDKYFEFNPNLKKMNFSSNDLQYLPPNLFYNLNEVEEIDFSNNHLSAIHSCIFSQLQLKEITRKYHTTKIKLNKNPIECDCDVFYLSRFANFKLNLTCHTPKVYANRTLASLYREDPSERCNYPRMSESCHPIRLHFKLELHWIVVIALVIALLLAILMFCCCRAARQYAEIESLKERANQLEKKNTRKTKQFFHSNSTDIDTQRLIVS